MEQRRSIPIRKVPRRRELCRRITILENLTRAQSDSSDDEADGDNADGQYPPTPRPRTPSANSVDKFADGYLKSKIARPLPFEDSLFASGLNLASSGLRLQSPAIRTTLFPIGGFKHEEDCRMLLATLKCAPNIQEILEQCGHFWARKMTSIDTDYSSADEIFIQYARNTLAGDNPIKIAKILQAVASVTLDIKLYKKLVLIVDRLIVSDDEDTVPEPGTHLKSKKSCFIQALQFEYYRGNGMYARARKAPYRDGSNRSCIVSWQ
jgi:hypothetical protein